LAKLIWRKADRYRPERGSVLAWMAAIVRNCALDALRAYGSAPAPLPEQGSPQEAGLRGGRRRALGAGSHHGQFT